MDKIFTTFGCLVAILAYAWFVVSTCVDQGEQGSGLEGLATVELPVLTDRIILLEFCL